MIRTIHLHGALGKKYGRKIRMDVASPAEAVRALSLQIKGFAAYVEKRYYQVFRGTRRDGVDVGPRGLHLRLGDDLTEIHIVPRAAGAKNDGLGKILLGGLLIAASFVIPGAWAIGGKAVAGILGQAGLAMALGGVSSLLAQQADKGGTDEDQAKSDLFGAPVNLTSPGSPWPIVVGRCEVASVMTSSAIHVEDRAPS